MFNARDVKDLMFETNMSPLKRLGQNFLIDKNIKNKIISCCKINKFDTILEIGPGLGALTSDLCKHSKSVIAIEKDKGLFNYLKKTIVDDNLTLINNDILKYKTPNRSNIKVIGNLPYYITTPIITKFINERKNIDSCYFSMQKEVSERLLSKPSSKNYGSITCFVNFYCEIKSLFILKRNVFYPIPKVDSCFVELKMRNKPLYLTNERKLFKIIRASFEKRRKNIVNALYSSEEFETKEEVISLLKQENISQDKRPEDISLEEFSKLAKRGK